MSIATPTWTIGILGRPLYTSQIGLQVSWQRIPNLTGSSGFGFGQGGFGQGGFGGSQTQTGTAQPVWVVDDVQ
jgi:hypothetical protein